MTFPWLKLEAKRDPQRQWLTWAVRMKLDLCGYRISRKVWWSLSSADQAALHDMPAETPDELAVFRGYLQECLAAAGLASGISADYGSAEIARRTLDSAEPPAAVSRLLEEWAIPADWAELNRFGRYVLWTITVKRDPESYRHDLAALFDSVENAQLRKIPPVNPLDNQRRSGSRPRRMLLHS